MRRLFVAGDSTFNIQRTVSLL